jgi:hypothetical protein
MTFFYDLNKKLDSIRAKPETTHKQLNERDEGKPGKNFEKIAKDAGERYGSKAAGERVAGAVRNKLKAQGKLEEEGMSRAAKGYEKYGKEGMEALAKAGREGKALDPVRAKYDKYDKLDEVGDTLAGQKKLAQVKSRAEKRAFDDRSATDSKYAFKQHAANVRSSDRMNQPTEEGLGNVVKKIGQGMKKVGSVALDKLGHGSDEDLLKDLQKKVGMPQTGKKPMAVPRTPITKEEYGPLEEKPMTGKQKSFAALAEPKDKIAFADKIAGAKKEVDEMLGDVAAEAMKGALRGGQKKLDKNNNGKLDANDFAMLRKGGKQETDEGWDDMIKDLERRRSTPKIGSITHGSKHDVEEIPGGRRVTRRTDPNTGYSVGADDDGPADGEKRGRGRPKGTKAATGAKGPSGKSKLMTKEGDNESDDIKQAMAMLKKAGYKVTKAADGAEQVDEKAVSKKQQRFMGMVHATQKGEKAPSKEVAKVAKGMGKKDAEDFATTKHKGLPEKKKPEGKKKEKTEESGVGGTTSGSVATAPAAASGKGGMSFGKGIYDSMNRDLEQMIAESMNVSMNMNSDSNGGPTKSLTVTATDEDAVYLGKLLKMAGMGGEQGGGCGCGSEPCSCDTNAEMVDENQPDWPTNTETSDNAMQYSGGLNKPKSTGQTTVPVIASQEERQYADDEEDAIKRMMEMAGIKTEAKKPDANKDGIPDYAQDGKGSKDLGKAKDKEKKVDEGILAATANLWKAYKG